MASCGVADCGLCLSLDLEVANQRQVVGKANRRYRKVSQLDAVAVEHEVELPARRAARIRGQPTRVRAPELRRFHEEINLVIAPERVEVARDDHGLARGDDEVV